MGFTIEIYLHCDGNSEACECSGGLEACECDGGFTSILEYKNAMERYGWEFAKNNKAYCSICKVKKTANEERMKEASKGMTYHRPPDYCNLDQILLSLLCI